MLLPISLIVFGNMTWCCLISLWNNGISEEYIDDEFYVIHLLHGNQRPWFAGKKNTLLHDNPPNTTCIASWGISQRPAMFANFYLPNPRSTHINAGITIVHDHSGV